MTPNEVYLDPCNVGASVVLPDTFDAPTKVDNDDPIYRFWKVEDFFKGFDNVVNGDLSPSDVHDDGMYACKSSVYAGIKAVSVAESNPFTLQVSLSDDSLLLLEVLRYDTVRLRWGPQKKMFSDYSQHLSRSLVMDTLQKLRQQLSKDEDYILNTLTFSKDDVFEWSILRDHIEYMKVVINYRDDDVEAYQSRAGFKVRTAYMACEGVEQRKHTDAHERRIPHLRASKVARRTPKGSFVVALKAVRWRRMNEQLCAR